MCVNRRDISNRLLGYPCLEIVAMFVGWLTIHSIFFFPNVLQKSPIEHGATSPLVPISKPTTESPYRGHTEGGKIKNGVTRMHGLKNEPTFINVSCEKNVAVRISTIKYTVCTTNIVIVDQHSKYHRAILFSIPKRLPLESPPICRSLMSLIPAFLDSSYFHSSVHPIPPRIRTIRLLNNSIDFYFHWIQAAPFLFVSFNFTVCRTLSTSIFFASATCITLPTSQFLPTDIAFRSLATTTAIIINIVFNYP
ncbi:hypothetical protein AYI69_g2840 [Smittium culicis]|uniref:Uncharacterized protein n=1 Tax=Smittium culicis TaxID=133412 RepID=A0A1R1YLA3_9FUNG|nr:hypothetical protein AYI69_g2840 [Smittium culicis]